MSSTPCGTADRCTVPAVGSTCGAGGRGVGVVRTWLHCEHASEDESGELIGLTRCITSLACAVLLCVCVWGGGGGGERGGGWMRR
jgi:hypothetical protein